MAQFKLEPLEQLVALFEHIDAIERAELAKAASMDETPTDYPTEFDDILDEDVLGNHETIEDIEASTGEPMRKSEAISLLCQDVIINTLNHGDIDKDRAEAIEILASVAYRIRGL